MTTINPSIAVTLVNDDVKLISVTLGNKAYTFKTLLPDVKVDDKVLVETCHGITVGKVHDVDIPIDISSDITYKWAFAFVDTEKLEKLKEREAEAVREIKRFEHQRMREQLAQQAGFSRDELPKIPL